MAAGRLAGAAVAFFAASILVACGPRHLSALGNPGDLCTERTACVDGTDCRITEEGYRCVGRDGRPPATESRSSGFSAASEEAGPDTEQDTAIDDEGQIGDEESPPVRSRRGRRGRRD